MKVVVTKASDWDFREMRDLEGPQQFVDLLRELGTVIVGQDPKGEAEFDIQVYDTYVE